jgi:hypothetical protein
MQITDPAVSAALELQRAEEHLLGLPTKNAEDELSEKFVAAEARWETAELTFADAVPTSSAGVMAKLNALKTLLNENGDDGKSVEQRHVVALISYFKRMS